MSPDRCVMDHVNIVVQDMKRAVEFYRAVLGLEPGFEGMLHGEWIDSVTGLHGVAAHCVFMQSPGIPVRLELLQYLLPAGEPISGLSAPQVLGVRHLAFRVPDLDQFYRHAQRHGVVFVSQPVAVPFPLPGGVTKRLCYFHDPDGVLLEAAEYR